MSKANKSIFFKTKYLFENLKEIEEKFANYYADFFKEVGKVCGSDPSKDSSDSSVIAASDSPASDDLEEEAEKKVCEDDSSTDADSPEVSGEIKKLYKKIALITHPDKHPDYLSEEKKKEMIDIYNRSTMAAKSNNLFILLDAASELYLDIPELSKEDMMALEEKCAEFEKRIKEIKNTYPWVWASQGDENQKENILNHFLDAKGYKIS